MADTFDPDAYLAQTSPTPTPAFDPDQYLAATATQTGEVAPPVIKDSVPERPSAVAQEAVGAAPTSQVAANLGGAVTDIVKGIPQMALDTAKMGYEGLKFAALPQERPQILEKAVTQGLEQGRQLASDVQSPLGSRESFRGIAQLGMMAAPALGDILFPKPEGLAAPPVQRTEGATTAPPLTETLFGKEKQPLVDAVNEGLTEAEQQAKYGTPPLGKQEPVAPDLPTGTGEAPKITAAAIQDSETGKTFTGPSHPQIYDKFPQIEGDPSEAFTGEGWNTGGNYVDGFVDQHGKFYDREEAAALHGLTNEASMTELEAVAGKISDKAPYKIIKSSPVSEAPVSTTATPDFAKSFSPETILTPPKWAYDKYGKAFEDKIFEVIHKPDAQVDITPIWKVMTPTERQELLSRGFNAVQTRKAGQVALGVKADAIPARNYFRMQEQRASSVPTAESVSTATPLTQTERSISGNKTPVAQTGAVGKGDVQIHPRFQLLGSRGRGEATPASDYDLVTKLTPEEHAAWVNTPEGEYPVIPQEIKDAANAGHDVFIETEGQAWKVEPHPVSEDPNHVVVERVSQIEKNLLAKGRKPTSVSVEGQAPTGSVKPETSATSQEIPTGSVTPETPQISTKNAYTEAQRAIRGLPEAEQAAKRGFGKVWDEAAAQAEKDPTIGRRLVAEINAKPRPISDVENAHLLRREIEAQKEHSDAVDAVNSATTDSDLTAAKARLEVARNELQDVYDATKSAGTKGGQALAARQMLAKEDYSLAKMEARRRAANDGKPLNEQQLAETKALHGKITDLQSKLDAHEVAARFNNEFNKLVEQSRKEAKASKASGTRFTDFMDRKADEARSRITERRGRLTTGFDPTAITDEAIIGASHIAKGVTKFADWSVEMAKEFGDQIRPFLKELWERSKAFHDANAKEYGDKALARYKTYLGKQTEQIKGKLEAGDFTKVQRQKTQLDKEAFQMRADLQKLKNQFERGVAKEAYQNKSPAQKFWDHFVGVERAMKLSGPEVFGKLGVAAAVREALAPIESGVGFGVSKVFPKLAKGTKYEADLGTLVRAELKAKAALFTDGIRDAAQNVKGQETGLDAIGKQKIRPDFWYNRIGQMHAAIKAPVKRAEFTRDLEQRMAVAVKNGEDINHPEVMTRLANESVMEANRAIFQNKTVVSNVFSTLDRASPVAGRVARFLFPVVKIPVNLFKELVNLHVGAPVGAARVGMAYWKGVETLPAVQREAIIRQLTKGSIGGAGLLWGYYNSDKVRNFFDHVPTWFNHTPMAMILNEGSYLKKLGQGKDQAKEGKKELAYMAKTDIPFMYTIKDIGDALDTHNSHALLGWINNMTQSTVVPQISTQVAKQMDKPGTFPSNLGEKPTYRPAANPLEAVKLGIPGLRQTIPVKENKHTGVSRRR